MSYNNLVINFSFHQIRQDNLLEGKPYSSIIAVPYDEDVSIPVGTPSYDSVDWRLIYCPEIPPSSSNYELNINANTYISGMMIINGKTWAQRPGEVTYYTQGRVSNRYKIYYYDNSLNAWLFTGNILYNNWNWYFNVTCTSEDPETFNFSDIIMIDGDSLPAQFDFTNNKYSLTIENVNIDRNILIDSVTNTGFILSKSPAGDSMPAVVTMRISRV